MINRPPDEQTPSEPAPLPPTPDAPTGAGLILPKVLEWGGGAPTPDAPSTGSEQDASVLPNDLIGDIPPPPVPAPPSNPSIVGSGVAGIRGTEAGTFARPGTRGASPYHTARFGPGTPSAAGSGMLPEGLGMTPQEAADILRRMAMGGS